MQIVYMNGGLGNQMFQYVFMRWLEETTGEECIIDDAPFFLPHTPHNGYELERVFGLRPKRLSEYFSADVWQEMLARRPEGVWGVAQVLSDGGLSLMAVQERNTSNLSFRGQIIPYTPGTEFPRLRGHIYCHGYWLTNLFYLAIREKIEREFVFPPFTSEANLGYERLIKKSHCPVSIHIRRGDMARHGWCAPPSFFRQAILKAETEWHPDRYFLFTDDFEWCHILADALGLAQIRNKLTPVRGNIGAGAYRDMQLMAMCRNHISDRSSFSLMAGLLSPFEDGEDINRWGMTN
ncbi:MAG: alpha-1,2-fucosyltransferase [Selenomonadaceae bacterium]|nr:alpha-1,2-fucosyltransferase [Selenomonadaceae bacterium]